MGPDNRYIAIAPKRGVGKPPPPLPYRGSGKYESSVLTRDAYPQGNANFRCWRSTAEAAEELLSLALYWVDSVEEAA